MSPADAPVESTETDAAATAVEAVEEVVPDELRDGIVAQLAEHLGDALVDRHVAAGQDMWIRVANGAWAQTASVLRNALGARYFCYLSAIDWRPSPYGRYLDAEVDKALAGTPTDRGEAASGPYTTGVAGGETRFQLIARVSNVRDHWGITIKADTTSDEDPHIETWTKVYAGADWHERETWEMFGITFDGHPHLRHIYLPAEFEGHPLRKDYPLLSRIVKPWPGIVDVEPMPTSDEAEAPEEGGEPE